MKLLKVPFTESEYEYLETKDFTGASIPQYAILSHTWTDDEISLKDIESKQYLQRAAYPKLEFTLHQARKDGYDWAWVDTCCIDKNGSTELQEAINSMFAWYRNSACCYVYLADVTAEAKSTELGDEFAKSRWFTRGWTLQELLAPRKICFFNQAWNELGRILEHSRSWPWEKVQDTERDRILLAWIVSTTAINEYVITGYHKIEDCTVAERMSWAAARTTTREEDLAYCLLGLFDVSMPLFYGEGSRAFVRLQEEILKRSDDTSILCWTRSAIESDMRHPPFLAFAPECLAPHRHLPHQGQSQVDVPPYAMTNKGLQATLPLIRIFREVFLAVLFHTDEGNSWGGVYLRRVKGANMVRILSDRLGTVRKHDVAHYDIVVTSVMIRLKPAAVTDFSLMTPGLPIKIHDASGLYSIHETFNVDGKDLPDRQLWSQDSTQLARHTTLAERPSVMFLDVFPRIVVVFRHLVTGDHIAVMLGLGSYPVLIFGLALMTQESTWPSRGLLETEVVGHRQKTLSVVSDQAAREYQVSLWIPRDGGDGEESSQASRVETARNGRLAIEIALCDKFTVQAPSGD